MVVGELEVIHMGDGVCNAWGEVEDGWHDDGKEGKAGDKRDKYADHPRYDKTKFDPKTYTRNVNGVVMTWSQRKAISHMITYLLLYLRRSRQIRERKVLLFFCFLLIGGRTIFNLSCRVFRSGVKRANFFQNRCEKGQIFS